MHRIGEKRRLTLESTSDVICLTESPPEKKSCVRRESNIRVSAKGWFQSVVHHLSHWLADMFKPTTSATSWLNDRCPDSKVYDSGSEHGLGTTRSCSPISHITSTSSMGDVHVGDDGIPAACVATSTPRGEDSPFSPTTFFSKPPPIHLKSTAGQGARAAVDQWCSKDNGSRWSTVRVSTNSSLEHPQNMVGGSDGPAAGQVTSTPRGEDSPFSPNTFFSKHPPFHPRSSAGQGARGSYKNCGIQRPELHAPLHPKTCQRSPPQMVDTSSTPLRSFPTPATLHGYLPANGMHSWHKPHAVPAFKQVKTGLPAPPWSRPRVTTTSTPAVATADERSELDRSSRPSSPRQPRHVHTKHSSRQHEVKLLSTWMEEFKFDLKHFQAEQQVIVDVAVRKLQLYQKQRLAMEDVMVGRLRQTLSDSHLHLDQTPSWVLSSEQMEQVAMAVSRGKNDECLSERYRIRISRSDLHTLTGSVWLNDEVINFYFNMIQECCNVAAATVRVHVFNSFFYTKLSQTGYGGVRRWTKKVDVFECDLILLPVHLGMHWCLAIIDLKARQFLYFDSLLGNNTVCLDRLRNYLKCECEDKKKMTLDLSSWSYSIPKDIPQQENISDCGVFTCMYARHKAFQLPFNFSQEDMPKMRNLMIYEILQRRLNQPQAM